MRPRRFLSVAWLGWSAALTSSALLTVASAALGRERFEVPDGCGTESAFASEFERLTGNPLPDEVPSSLVIEELSNAGYELRLLVAEELRVLRDPDCRTLWRSAIVISAAASGLTAPAAIPAEPVPVEPAPAAAPEPPPTESSPGGADPDAPRAPLAAGPVSPASRPPAPMSSSASAGAGSSAEPAPTPATPRPRTKPRARASIEQEPAARGSRPPDGVSSAPGSSQRVAPRMEARGVRYGLGLGAGVSGGVLPGLAASLEVGARLEVGSWAGLVSLRYWPERSERLDGRGVEVSALGVGAAASFRATSSLRLLGGVELNRLAGVGLEGVSGRNADNAWQLAPTLAMSFIVWDIRHLRIELGALGRASLVRPTFVVTGFGELYRVPAFGADAIIRGVWLFP